MNVLIAVHSFDLEPISELLAKASEDDSFI